MKARLYYAICMNDATCNIGTCAIVELSQQRCSKYCWAVYCMVWSKNTERVWDRSKSSPNCPIYSPSRVSTNGICAYAGLRKHKNLKKNWEMTPVARQFSARNHRKWNITRNSDAVARGLTVGAPSNWKVSSNRNTSWNEPRWACQVKDLFP